MTAVVRQENAMKLPRTGGSRMIQVLRAGCDQCEWYGASNLEVGDGPAYFLALLDAVEHNRLKGHPPTMKCPNCDSDMAEIDLTTAPANLWACLSPGCDYTEER